MDRTFFARRSLALLALLLVLAPLPRAGAQDTASSAAAPTVPAARKAQNVAIITIRGAIDGDSFGNSVMASSIERRIKTAYRAGADAIVFDLDTPGGEVGASLRISGLIKQCPIPNTVAWINPNAFSGGAIVGLAAREMIVSESARFGDAMPVQMGPQGPRSITDTELLRKILPPLISDVLDSARRVNEASGAYIRDEYLLQAIVATDVQLWWVRNVDTGVEMAVDASEFQLLFPNEAAGGPTRLAPAPGPRRPSIPGEIPPPGTQAPAGSEQLSSIAGDVESRQTRVSARPRISGRDVGKWVLVDKITDGSGPATFTGKDMIHYNLAVNGVKGEGGGVVLHSIETDEQIKAFFGAKNVRRLNKSWAEGLVLFLTNPIVRGVLIAIFLIALFGEMSHPGALLPGLISAGALVALLGPPLLIGMAGVWEVVAILAGIALLAVEIFVIPGFGVAGVSGLVLVVVGLIGTFLPQGSGLFPSSERGQQTLLWASVILLASFMTAGVSIYFLARHLGSLPVLNRLVLQDVPRDDESGAGSLMGVETMDLPALGAEGVAITPMHPSGRVDINGKVIDAVSELGFITAGSRVRVVSVDGIRIGVEGVSG